MIQTNASTVEFAVLMARVNVNMVQLEIGVKSNQPITATVILITINMNLIMMVETAAKVHVSVQTCICGKDESGIVDIGYPHCNIKTEPYDQWFQSGNSVNGASLGTSVALVGRGGTVLAVGDPGASIVRLFDKDGSKWVQRGKALNIDSYFDMFISLTSGESENVMMNNYSSPTVTLAVGGWVDDFSGFVRVYYCYTIGCKQIGSDIILGSTFSVSLSRGEIHVLFPIMWTILQTHSSLHYS